MPRLKAFILFSLSVFFLLTPNPSAFAEDITITTYYPAPYGVYKEMRSKRMAIGDTYYDGGDYCWEGSPNCTNDIDADADLIIEGNVGIGTASPSSGLKLDVAGKVGATEYCDQNGSNCVVAGTGVVSAKIASNNLNISLPEGNWTVGCWGSYHAASNAGATLTIDGVVVASWSDVGDPPGTFYLPLHGVKGGVPGNRIVNCQYTIPGHYSGVTNISMIAWKE